MEGPLSQARPLGAAGAATSPPPLTFRGDSHGLQLWVSRWGWEAKDRTAHLCPHMCVCPCRPDLEEAPGAAGYEDVRVAGRLEAPLVVGGGRERQQGIAVDPEQDRVDHGYAGDGEAHALEEAQDLQGEDALGWVGDLGLPFALPAPARPPPAGTTLSPAEALSYHPAPAVAPDLLWE